MKCEITGGLYRQGMARLPRHRRVLLVAVCQTSRSRLSVGATAVEINSSVGTAVYSRHYHRSLLLACSDSHCPINDSRTTESKKIIIKQQEGAPPPAGINLCVHRTVVRIVAT